jgi:two-component system cell cycle sensor histidine kinase PleC
MIQQVAINLATNAIKFTPPGGSVSLAHELNADGSYALIVCDTGAGMTREEVSRALVPFGQIENAMNRKHPGTGLGLPLSKAMIELHDGSLHVRSEPQLGTTVRLLFPRSRVRAGNRVAPRQAMTA